MKVSGFTFVRNAIKFDYPVVESITSILPICDEMVVAVGSSDDETLSLIKKINSTKIKIIETVWDDSLREGGKVLAVETNKAFKAVSDDAEWAFYIQADEILHEKYLESVYREMKNNAANDNVDGLLFDYKHFYGSYDYIGESYRWYRKEIRVIRNDKSIYSYLDAQGFRKGENFKLKVKTANAEIFHYGWVKHPAFQQQKQEHFNKLWHNDDWINKKIKFSVEFDYSEVDSLVHFDGTHPQVMQERISKTNWHFEHDISKRKYSFKEKLKRIIEKITGYRLGEYKNYILIN
jgi:hypothetical protein